MLPQILLQGCLQTYSPEQVHRHCSSDHPPVLLVVLAQLESVSPIMIRRWCMLTTIILV